LGVLRLAAVGAKRSPAVSDIGCGSPLAGGSRLRRCESKRSRSSVISYHHTKWQRFPDQRYRWTKEIARYLHKWRLQSL